MRCHLPNDSQPLQRLNESGFLHIANAVSHLICDQFQLVSRTIDGAGSRTLLAHPTCREIVIHLKSHLVVASLLPSDPVAIQCTLFDKSPKKNWLVSLHQDLSIPVRERTQNSECSGWSQKEGQWFVQPPVNVLEGLVAVRVHLDASTADNGPLRVVPGSHLQGRLASSEADAQRQATGEVSVLAARGDAIAMRPLLLHASSKAIVPRPRRVLHFVFGPRELTHGLAWAHVV